MTSWPPPALVLTAGVGSRLRPLSDLRAKPALPVAGEALVRRILRALQAQGIRDVVLNLHHRPETVTRVVGDGSDLGLRVRYSWEPALLGSAGGPRRALPLLAVDRLLLVNGDSLTNLDLRAIWDAHARGQARVTMAVVPFPAVGSDCQPARYGGVVLDETGAVVRFSRRHEAADAWHFIGVQVVNRDVFDTVPESTPVETTRALYPALLATQPGAVRGFVSGASFRDIGTAADYLRTCLTLAEGEQEHVETGTVPVSLIGADCTVAPDAQVEGSLLWDRVQVGAGARLLETVVTDDVFVPPGARFERCIVMREADCPTDIPATRAGGLALVAL